MQTRTGFRQMQRSASATWVLAWLISAPLGAVHAAEIYRSIGPDGAPRYASQALDASYALAYTEPGTAPAGSLANSRTAARRAPPQVRARIDAAALRHGVDARLVEAVIAVESGFRANAVSARGARGMMQLMPSTAAGYGVHGERALHDPERNIDAGVRHLKQLLHQHGGNVALALAAYNAGPQAVQRHGARIPPYPETMLYVPAVLSRSAAAEASSAQEHTAQEQ